MRWTEVWQLPFLAQKLLNWAHLQLALLKAANFPERGHLDTNVVSQILDAKYAKVQVNLFTYAKPDHYWLWLPLVEIDTSMEQDTIGQDWFDPDVYCVPFCHFYFLYHIFPHKVQQLTTYSCLWLWAFQQDLGSHYYFCMWLEHTWLLSYPNWSTMCKGQTDLESQDRNLTFWATECASLW